MDGHMSRRVGEELRGCLRDDGVPRIVPPPGPGEARQDDQKLSPHWAAFVH